MTFRDDNDALRARIAQLEGELEEMRQELRASRGEDMTPKGNAFLGAPTKIVAERILPRELSEDDIESIVLLLRERYGELGRIERLGRSVTWTTRGQQQTTTVTDVTIERQPGQTRIRIEEHHGGLAGGLYGGLFGGLGFGMLTIVIVIGLAIGGGWLGTTALALAWLLSVYGGTRALFRHLIKKRKDRVDSAMRDIGPKLRVAAAETRDVEDRLREEQLVEEQLRENRIEQEAEDQL